MSKRIIDPFIYRVVDKPKFECPLRFIIRDFILFSNSMSDSVRRVIFICTHNSARSQMAEGFMNSRIGGRYRAFSAGTRPSVVNPYAVLVMGEVDIDISNQRSKGLQEFDGWNFDTVVTVCSDVEETCPYVPGREHIHRGFDDPSRASGFEEEIIEKFRRIRDEIWNWMKDSF